MTRAGGMVDPTSEPEVAAVLDAVLRTMGTGGVGDVLARLPGVRVQPGSPRRMLSKAVLPRVWVGAEDCWEVDDALGTIVRLQVVEGVVLHREVVPAGRLGRVLGGQLVRLTHEQASFDEAAVVLSGAWDAARD